MNWSVELDPRGNIHVRIIGYLDEPTARESARAMVALYSGKPREVYLEAEEMQGYRRGARVIWQERLWGLRGQIPRIVLVGGGSVVRMSTSVIAMALGVPLFVKEDASESPGEDSPVPRKRARSSSRPLTRPLSRGLIGTPNAAKVRRARAKPGDNATAADTWGIPVPRKKRDESRPC